MDYSLDYFLNKWDSSSMSKKPVERVPTPEEDESGYGDAWRYMMGAEPKVLNERVQVDSVKSTQFPANPNPIHAGDVGKDQDLTQIPLGNTYTPEDLQALHQMKIDLFDMQSDMIRDEILGKTTETKKIDSLKQQIDEFSDKLGFVYDEPKRYKGNFPNKPVD